MIISVKNLKKYFGKNHVLRDIDVDIEQGEVVVVVGSSGSGKSTFLRCLNLLAPPTSGNILIDGIDITNPSVDLNQIRRKVGMVFQSFNLFENMTVIENIKLAPKKLLHTSDAAAEKEARQLLKRVGLLDKADMMPKYLSGGQKQRIAIARALAMHPEAVLFDEPTSALDVSVRAQVLNLLADLKKELNLAMVFISHDIQTVRQVSDRIVVMYGGQILETGSTEDIFNHPTVDYTRKLLGVAPSLL